MKKILFVNHPNKECGVFRYGYNIYNAIKDIENFLFEYVECATISDLENKVKIFSPDIIIYNYHAVTLPGINFKRSRPFKNLINIGLMHDFPDRRANRVNQEHEFDYYIFGNPELKTENPRVFPLSRLIPDFKNSSSIPEIPTIGSFGFATSVKGYEKIVNLVQQEFEHALIKINIAPNSSIGDQDGKLAKKYSEKLNKMIKKPGISIEITNRFLSENELLNFLSKNSANVFLYNSLDFLNAGGISSAVDQAIAVERPIAVSNCNLFRHFFHFNPSIVLKTNSSKSEWKGFFNGIYLACKKGTIHEFLDKLDLCFFRRPKKYGSLKNIISNPTSNIKNVKNKWNLNHFKQEFSEILSKIVLHHKSYEGTLCLNRILDDSARELYQKSIQQIGALCPEMIKRKIPRANIQQAFVFDTVRKFASDYSKILSVGAYDDTATYALIQQNMKIECIDSIVNYSLEEFYHLPTTIKNSYQIIFSTSVLEHVENDELFMKQFVDLLAPNGIGILTCDFKDDWKAGDYIFPGNFRFYTQNDFEKRLLPLLGEIELLGLPQWNCKEPDFELGGQRYTFATLVFRKKNKHV